jgi:hypothetical protein
MDPGPFFYTIITIYHLLVLFTFSQTTIFYHSIRLILCLQQTGEIDNLTISWGKVLGYVVCRFHVAAGAKLRPGRGAIYKLSGAVAKLASINLRKLVLSPTSSINLGFILREDLLLCSSYLPLGVPNWAVIYTPSVAGIFYRGWRALLQKGGRLLLPVVGGVAPRGGRPCYYRRPSLLPVVGSSDDVFSSDGAFFLGGMRCSAT